MCQCEFLFSTNQSEPDHLHAICTILTSKMHPMYDSNLKEHGKGNSKEKGKNSSQRTPEGPSVFKTWVVGFCLPYHLLIQCVVEHLEIIWKLFLEKSCHLHIEKIFFEIWLLIISRLLKRSL